MDSSEVPASSFLKADEVDEPATHPDANPVAQGEGRLDSPQGTGLDTIDLQALDPNPESQKPALSRDQWASAPQQPPPPAPPGATSALEPSNPEDSLSLGALKRIVNEFPRYEPTPYAFEYHDFGNFPEELEELFGYSAEERESLLDAHKTFVKTWNSFDLPAGQEQDPFTPDRQERSWTEAAEHKQKQFLQQCGRFLKDESYVLRSVGLDCVLYIVLGNWFETAGNVDRQYLGRLAESDHGTQPNMAGSLKQRYKHASAQLAAIKRGIALVHSTLGAQAVFDAFRDSYSLHAKDEAELGLAEGGLDARGGDRRLSHQLWSSSVILYLLVDDAVRSQQGGNSPARASLVSMEPGLLPYLTKVLADMRWDDSDTLPAFKLFLLYWKATLLTFGTLEHVEQINTGLSPKDRSAEKRDDRPLITASPLDYHIFRQEITSKYPSFDPPAPLFAFEPENTSIVPPLQDREGKPASSGDSVGPVSVGGAASSIIHQPVHIATPAPSPPPSPAGPGGKGVKKQNYQTNQMFPFLYPPLEENSNAIGGKGSTELQDLVGRKWAGRDIPTSILEAADLFAERMRATRAMKQLWKERVRFMKYERGHDANDFSLDDPSSSAEARKKDDVDEGDELQVLDEDLRSRLSQVESFYAGSLPQLQSVIIVFMKVILQTVTALVTQPNAPNGLQNGFSSPDQNGVHANGTGGAHDGSEDGIDPLLYDLDGMRSQEIMSKAVSGTMLVLLKWFKASHVLKFEYLTQLILDSNYIQLLLKLFTHQEPERLVNFRCERRSLNFFRLCQSHSKNAKGKSGADALSPASSSSNASSGSEDDAAPPPISRHAPEAGATESAPPSAGTARTEAGDPGVGYPEVDELGNPTTQQSSEPITNFSWRNFFSLINHVRILQKVVKHKAHRQLLMVQYKYASVLRKNLKVPQPDVRLYTLKAIKGQVPYSHRKWRQSNMRIITAIYLHCRPELRDEWLAGIDVDQEMVEALPHERALRSLTYWHNLRLYPEAMGSGLGEGEDDAGLRQGEQDFFLRELERMDLVVRERGGSFDADGISETDQMYGEVLDAQQAMGLDSYVM